MLVTMLVILCWSSAARVIMLVTTLVILCWPSAATAYLRALGWRTGTARILSRELPRKLDSKRPNSSAAWASLHLQGRGGGGRTCGVGVWLIRYGLACSGMVSWAHIAKL